MVLRFNLKEKYYKMYLKGKKKSEYRHVCDYWSARISKLKKGDLVHLVKGYTKEYLEAYVEQWVMIPASDLPWYLRLIMDKSSMWFRVDLEVILHPIKGP